VSVTAAIWILKIFYFYFLEGLPKKGEKKVKKGIIPFPSTSIP